MYAFILGREFKLAIAEIWHLFPDAEIVFSNHEVYIVRNIDEDDLREVFPKMGGTVKIVKISDECQSLGDFIKQVKKELFDREYTGKYPFAMASYGERIDQFRTGLKIKNDLVHASDFEANGKRSLRLVNKDSQNINAAVFKKEHLAETLSEFNYIYTPSVSYFGYTILFQDVDAYAARDYGKSVRDMEVGMLPPKLAQMMINISGEAHGIYDPFAGLGTVLIEAAHGGYFALLGSDLSPAMVEATRENLQAYMGSSRTRVEAFEIFEQDAAKIGGKKELAGWLADCAIVTEGYLGEIMTPKTVNPERVEMERLKLAKLYDGFFGGLKKLGFTGKIVISFPFWEIQKKYYYCEEVYEVLEKYGFKSQKLLPETIEYKQTKT